MSVQHKFLSEDLMHIDAARLVTHERESQARLAHGGYGTDGFFQLMVLLPFIAQDSGTAFTNSTLLGAVVGAYYLTMHHA